MFNKTFKHAIGRLRSSEGPRRSNTPCSRRPSSRFEQLEDRRLLAINWINQATSNFNLYYGANAALATEIVSRAVADWNAVITNFNYAEDLDADPNNNLNNTFNLSIVAEPLSSTTRGEVRFADQSYNVDDSPTAGTVRLDDNGGGAGWFFDATPTDDAEFTGLAGRFSASFIDVDGQTMRDDLYRTVAHEIGHALGITSDVNAAIASMLTPLVNAQQQAIVDPTGFTSIPLKYFQSTRPSPQFGQVATFLSGHLYEGDLYLTNNDPTTVYRQGSATPLSFVTHPNDLLNDGRTVPAGNPNSNPAETARQFISDTDAMILADAYGYTVVLPSAINTAFASLDSETGALLVQGDRTLLGFGTNDTITVDTVGSDIRVQVNGSTELFPSASVQQIVIAQNGGTDTVTVAPGLAGMRRDVHHVVSTNQDSLGQFPGTPGDDIVDINLFIPGFQTSLRAAIVDVNGTAAGSSRSIYVPRGKYNLTIGGTGGDTQGDLDVSRNITVIGSGAGATTIDASTLPANQRDRLFEVTNNSGAILDVSRMTLTGGGGQINGGAILVGPSNNTLKLNQVAIVNNTATSGGGGVFVNYGSSAQIVDSVITGNTADVIGGGILASANAGPPAAIATVSLQNTIVANNSSPSATGDDLRSAATAGGTYQGLFTTLGGNLFTTVAGSNLTPGGLQASDHLGAVDMVVTSVVDSFNDADNARALSVREAVNQANLVSGVQTVWLPAWSFMLTRDRAKFGGGSLTDVSAAYGDLDITESLNIRGSGAVGKTAVKWRPGVVDAVFDLIGDFNGNGISTQDDGSVNGSDFLIWQSTIGSTTDLRADADDDGDVDGSDYSLWSAEYGNNLVLTNIVT